MLSTFDASGLLPLTPYEPTDAGEPLQRGDIAAGQLTLDDLITELRAARRTGTGPDIATPGRRMLHRVLAALLEVHTGRRPAGQLDPWLTPLMRRHLRLPSPPNAVRYVLRHIHVCRPTERALEVCGTAYVHERACAVAARLEHGPHGWRCAAFTVLEPHRVRGPRAAIAARG